MKILLALTLLIIVQQARSFTIYSQERLNTKAFNERYISKIVQIYKQIGINATVKYISESDINKRIKSGEFDAISVKMETLKSEPSTIQIKPAILPNETINRYKLRSSKSGKLKISVGVVKGVYAHSKTIIKNRSRFSKVTSYNSLQELMNALYNKEVDSILMFETMYKYYTPKEIQKKLELVDSNLYKLNFYHYINKKHAKIESKLSKELKKRVQAGDFK